MRCFTISCLMQLFCRPFQAPDGQVTRAAKILFHDFLGTAAIGIPVAAPAPSPLLANGHCSIFALESKRGTSGKPVKPFLAFRLKAEPVPALILVDVIDRAF